MAADNLHSNLPNLPLGIHLLFLKMHLSLNELVINEIGLPLTILSFVLSTRLMNKRSLTAADLREISEQQATSAYPRVKLE